MIKIRYSDLPGGLHVRVDVQGRHTILYLLPGLTAAQRKAAIRRASNAARVGHGPGLPALGVARALAADRIRTTVRNGLAAMRMHPAIFFPPLVIIVASAAAYLFFVSLSFRFVPPRAPAHGRIAVGLSHGGPTVPPSVKLGADAPPAGGAGPGRPGSPSGPVPSRGGSPAPAPSLPSPRAPSSPGPSASPSPAPSSAPSPAGPGPSPSPSTSPSPGSGGGVCVKVGPFGVCIGL